MVNLGSAANGEILQRDGNSIEGISIGDLAAALDHSALANRAWESSGHTGTAYQIPCFANDGEAAEAPLAHYTNINADWVRTAALGSGGTFDHGEAPANGWSFGGTAPTTYARIANNAGVGEFQFDTAATGVLTLAKTYTLDHAPTLLPAWGFEYEQEIDPVSNSGANLVGVYASLRFSRNGSTFPDVLSSRFWWWPGAANGIEAIGPSGTTTTYLSTNVDWRKKINKVVLGYPDIIRGYSDEASTGDLRVQGTSTSANGFPQSMQKMVQVKFDIEIQNSKRVKGVIRNFRPFFRAI